MRNTPRILFALALFLLPLAARANEFTSQDEIDALQTIDLNADGKKELIWQTGRKVRVYFYKEPRGYSMAEDRQAEIELPADIGLYAFGDVDGKPGLELVGMSGTDVRAWRLEGNAFRPDPVVLVTGATALENTLLEKPRPREILADLDGDGDLDMVLPSLTGYAFYRQLVPGNFELAQKMPLDVETTLSMGSGTFQNTLVRAVSFPRFWITDFDGDGKPDFLRFDGPVMHVHLRDANGLFTNAPARTFNFNKFVNKRRRRREMFDYFSAVSPEVADVDADGKADVVIMLPGKGKIGVFRGSGDKPYTEGQVVAVSGWTFRREGIPLIRDLDHDGRPDLVVLNIPQLGIWDVLEVFFSQKLEVKTFFYLSRTDGSFPVADHEFTATVPLILSVTRDSVRVETPFLITFGDLNGDGLDDMIVKDAPDRLDVRYGTKDGVFHKNIDRKIEIRDSRGMSSEPAIITDLNGDGLDDIVLHHRDFENKVTIVEVIRSRKE